MAPQQPETIGNRLQHALQQRDLNMSSLAYALGVSKSSVSDWIRGGGLTLSNAAAIAVELNVSLDWLLAGKGSMDLFGPLHPTTREMALIHALREAGNPAFTIYFQMLQQLSVPLLGEDPVNQILALEMMEKSQMAMAVVSSQGCILDLNEACLALLGDHLDKERDVLNTHFTDWLDIDDVPSALRHMEAGMREGHNSHFPGRFNRKRYDSRRFVDVIVSAVYHGCADDGHFECALFPLD